MPRASRYFLPGYVWHITHRCHQKEFLLKFSRDRKRWLGNPPIFSGRYVFQSKIEDKI
jgi:hypothetical protein